MTHQSFYFVHIPVHIYSVCVREFFLWNTERDGVCCLLLLPSVVCVTVFITSKYRRQQSIWYNKVFAREGGTTKLENFWCFRQQCIWILGVFDNNVYEFYKDFSSLLRQSSLGFYKSTHLESDKDLVRIQDRMKIWSQT